MVNIYAISLISIFAVSAGTFDYTYGTYNDDFIYHNHLEYNIPNCSIDNLNIDEINTELITFDLYYYQYLFLEITDDDSGNFTSSSAEINFEKNISLFYYYGLDRIQIYFEVDNYDVSIYDDDEAYNRYEVGVDINIDAYAYDLEDNEYTYETFYTSFILNFNVLKEFEVMTDFEDFIDGALINWEGSTEVYIENIHDFVNSVLVIQDDAYENGYDTGVSQNFKDAYEKGYSDAIAQGGGILGLIREIFNTLIDIGNIEILPNIKLWYFLGIPLVIGIVSFVLGWFR